MSEAGFVDAKGTRNEPVALSDLHWQIERYDRLRASVASRASYILSANALVLAGTALAVNQLGDRSVPASFRTAALVVIFVLLASVTTSVWAGVGALATLGPRFQESELPRGLYGWSTTHLASPTYEGFCAFLEQHDAAEGARAELFLIAKQQAHRYGRLRLAMKALLIALAGFVLLVSLGAIASLT